MAHRGRGIRAPTPMRLSVRAVSMARSEYCRCPPRLPTPTASQVAIASGANHTVISPRWTSARSYAGQFPTWYCVLYFGCTLDFMSRSCTCCRHDGQEVDRGSPRARDPCTNADETERQGGFDGEIGILELPAPPADASRCPRGDRVRREPEGDVASPHEGSVGRWCMNRNWPATILTQRLLTYRYRTTLARQGPSSDLGCCMRAAPRPFALLACALEGQCR